MDEIKKPLDVEVARDLWVRLSDRLEDKPEFVERTDFFTKDETDLYTNLTHRFAHESKFMPPDCSEVLT